MVDGKRIKAVIAANKMGFLYVFDRVTGKPVWPIENVRFRPRRFPVK